MKLRIETTNVTQKVLIVDKDRTSLFEALKVRIKKYNNEVFASPRLPKNLGIFDTCFFINDPSVFKKPISQNSKKLIFIFINQKNQAERYFHSTQKHNIKNCRFISLCGDENFIKNHIDNILWFAFSPTQESFLNLQQFIVKSKTYSTNRQPDKIFSSLQQFSEKLDKRKFIFIILFAFFLFHLLFLPPLIISDYIFFHAGLAFKKDRLQQAKDNLYQGSRFLEAAKKLYEKSRPTYLLFSLASIPDNFLQISEKAKSILQQSIILYENSDQIIKLILNKNKTSVEKKNLLSRLDKLKTDLEDLEENLVIFNQKIPTYMQTKELKNDLLDITDVIIKIKKFSPLFDELLAQNTERNYLLLFANNMELRPGGGFISSFAVLTMKDLTLADIKIYDVYDADGRLTAHIEPPEAIKKYLRQPHWFLRDSAFSPDFIENYAWAKTFLEKTLGITNISAGILVTTSAVQNLLSAFGNIYLPDFKEIINRDNFYIKLQVWTEKDFFPGSTQKKSFLTSLVNQLIISLEKYSSPKIVRALKKSLDEKQLVVYFDNPELEKPIDESFWSGRVIEPKCPIDLNNCLSDYLFLVDANVGANKANFFISRYFESTVNIDNQGNIKVRLTAKFKNYSQSSILRDIYRNYFQVYLSKDSIINKITKNDVLIENYDEKIDQYNKIGFYFETPPQSTTEITLDYRLKNKLTNGRSVYQIIVQKQIGSSNNDLLLRINFPKNVYLINQNFSPLVKNNQIVYNTNLSADKIFLTELIKE